MEHLVIEEEDVEYFNRLVKIAVKDGFEIISSNSHWDNNRNATVYYAMAVNKNSIVDEDGYDIEEFTPDAVFDDVPINEVAKIRLSSVDYLLAYATKTDLTTYCTESGENEIKPEWDEDYTPQNSLGRIFNNRRGFLPLADFTDEGILLINDFLLTTDELSELTYKIKNKYIKYKIIHFTPDDFSRGYRLVSYNEYLDEMHNIQKQRNKVNFFQWLFR